MKRRTLFDFHFKASKRSKEEDDNSLDSDEVSAEAEEKADNAEVDESSADETSSEKKRDSNTVTVDRPAAKPCSTRSDTRDNVNDERASVSGGKKVYLFQKEWMSKWPWLENQESGMRCRLCMRHEKQNTFTSPGCFNYRTSTLERHVNTRDHQLALQADVLQKDFSRAADTAVKRDRANADAGIVAAMRTVHWMAQEDIPIKKYSSLLNLQRAQGCEAVAKLAVAGKASYSCRSSGEEFQACVAEEVHQRIVRDIRQAEMYSLLVDESTDISVSKHVVIYARIVDPSFVPRTFFLKNVTVEDPKSDAAVIFGCIKQTLADCDLDLKKIKGFGSDGAAVMVGKKRGVSALVKEKSPHCINIHCMAHRLNLASSQASKDIPYLKEVEKTLSDLYYYLGGSKSANRQCALEEIQKILNDPILKVKQCHEIRWLAFFEAVRAVFSTWSSLFTFFSTRTDSKAKILFASISQYKFLSVLAMFMDVLPSVAQLSMVLQKRDLDIACVQPAVDNVQDKIQVAKKGRSYHQRELKENLAVKKDSSGETVTEVLYKKKPLQFGSSLRSRTKEVEEIRESFCAKLCENIGNRFPSDTKDIASAFGVLGMRPLSFLSETEKEEYGVKELHILTDFYGKKAQCKDCVSEALISKEQCLEEWSLAKKTVLQNMYPRVSTKTLYKLIHDYHKDSFPNLLVLAKLALIMPYQTADCERGFSCQNGIKTVRRSKLKEDSLNTLMTIKCEGGSLEDYDFDAAAVLWKSKKERRLYKKM